MAPLSVLPGRVRFESRSLVGSLEKCLHLEERICALAGITEASANHRTGRVLVRFDERLVSRGALERQVNQALLTLETAESPQGPLPSRRKPSRDAATTGTGNFLMEVALHAFLPAPFDLLLPAAAALRK